MASHSVRDYQIRVNSLNIGVNLSVDNQMGDNTRAGIRAAMEHLRARKQTRIFDSSGLKRIHLHWTASTYAVNWNVVKHYNDVFDVNGKHYEGGAPAIDQVRYSPRGAGVSHTFRANTGAIGMSVAAMAGATSSGSRVNPGPYPMNWEMIDAMLKRTAYYCKKYDIRVSPWTILTHAEIQPTLKIKQKGKWDIRCLPDDITKLLSAREAGDILRDRLERKFL